MPTLKYSTTHFFPSSSILGGLLVSPPAPPLPYTLHTHTVNIHIKEGLWIRNQNFFFFLDPEWFVSDPDPGKIKRKKSQINNQNFTYFWQISVSRFLCFWFLVITIFILNFRLMLYLKIFNQAWLTWLEGRAPLPWLAQRWWRAEPGSCGSSGQQPPSSDLQHAKKSYEEL